MKRKNYLVLVAMLMTVSIACCGCGKIPSMMDKDDTQVVEDVENEVVEESVEESEEEPVEVEDAAEDVEEEETEEPTEELEVEAEEETEEEEESDAVEITGEDWTSMKMVFEGKEFKLPMPYSELEAMGWTFDLADYGYENGYAMNPGDKVTGTIKLENSNYDEKFNLRLTVGFLNTSDEVLDIKECDIWSFELETCAGSKQAESYPSMKLANGIEIGSTKADVEAVCGACDDIYVASSGYEVYTYRVDDYKLRMVIYEDMGVTNIGLETYE